jgi:tripartite-type tricarboxylate transporter receptor subunit TctC
MSKLLAILLIAVFPVLSTAQTYPDKPIRLIVAAPAGATADVVIRMIQPGWSKLLGEQVVVDNRGGAGGLIGAEFAANAAPDGYTIYFGAPGPLTVVPHLQKKMPYDTLKDFAPISLVAIGPYLLVAYPSAPFNSTQELVAYAKAHPGKLSYASAGNGSTNHLATEYFKSVAGIDILHVPYRGAPQMVTDLLGGHVDMTFNSIPPVLQHIKMGRLKCVGISSLKRSPLLPDIPTLSESGVPGYEWSTWLGMLAPAKTPALILKRLHDTLVQVVRAPEIKTQLDVLGYDTVVSEPKEFADFLRADWQKNAKAVKVSGAKVD